MLGVVLDISGAFEPIPCEGRTGAQSTVARYRICIHVYQFRYCERML